MRSSFAALVCATALACGADLAVVPVDTASAATSSSVATEPAYVQAVAGKAVHFVTTAIIHSTETTPTGMIQRSTETVDLTGDVTGRILYHPTSVFDFSAGTLVNTGRQVFSGTVLGSAPVMLYDDAFRFEVNLVTGAGAGKVYLTDNLAGPKIRCELEVITTGKTPEGNITASYTGRCSVKKA